MRYSKDHKELARARIVDAASRAFRRDGIVATGVVGLMAEAGLTQGGFYAHFASKDALIEAALDRALAATVESLANRIRDARSAGSDPIVAAIDVYLSEDHLRSAEVGCAMGSLGPEIGRQCDAARRAAARRIDEIVALLAAELPDAHRHRAGPLFAMLAGTLQMARVAEPGEAQAAILRDGRHAARDLMRAERA